MNKIKMFTVLSLSSMMGVAGIAAGSSRISFVSKAAATPRTYDIVSLIAEQLDSSQEIQDVTITVDGFDFTYRTRNASKVIVGGKTTIQITNGYLYNATTLNGLKYVDVTATEQSGKGNIVLAKPGDIYTDYDGGFLKYYDTTLCTDGVQNFFGKMTAVDNACCFSIVSKETIQLSKIEISYTCTTGDSELVRADSNYVSVPDEFKMYIGSSGKVLNIYSLQDFVDFSAMTRQPIASKFDGWTINLLNDITVNASVFVRESLFNGTFNGNGHTITYTNKGPSNFGTFTPSPGLFCRFDGGAVINNLTLDADVEYSNIGGCGALTPAVESTNSREVTINNVDVKGSVVCTEAGVGGLVGYSSFSKVNFIDCQLLADSTVSGSQMVGGLIGSQSEGLISSCKAYGSVTGNTLVGGICGESSSDISNCEFHGTLNVNGTKSGAIAGALYNRVVDNCIGGKDSILNVPTDLEVAYFGGIIGYLEGACTIEKCTVYQSNTGAFTKNTYGTKNNKFYGLYAGNNPSGTTFTDNKYRS